jgi:hypothetical protein
MAELKPLEGTNYFLWFYLPQMWASLLFLALFIILTGLQIWKMVKTRTWFCIPFVIGGICKSGLGLGGTATTMFTY